MADTLVKKPKLIVGTQSQVEAEMGADDIGFATDIEFYTSKQIDELLSKAGGASLPILMPVWSDHLLNDMSWLRADTFSWQSGDVYKAAYEHLVGEFNSGKKYYAWAGLELALTFYTEREVPLAGDILYTTGLTEDEWTEYGVLVSDYDGSGYLYVSSQSLDVMRSENKDIVRGSSDTIGDITITYCLAEDGHKICLPDQESSLIALYEATGAADYYLLDTTNKLFKLPRKQKRKLIQAVKNNDGTWHNLYSDGWVEQGGQIIRGVITFAIPMADLNYTVSGAQIRSGSTSGTYYNAYKFVNMRETGIDLDNAQSEDPLIAWSVSGYAAESAYASAGMRLEYYYVGNFEQSAVEQTAGLNSELFNGKADVSRVAVLEGYDYVVESQEPTAENNYTWYRKYKSGWVEQAGYWTGSISIGAYNVKTVDITLPIEMSDGNYYAAAECNTLNHVRVNTGYGTRVNTSTTMKVNIKEILNTTGTITRVEWYVCGQSA